MLSKHTMHSDVNVSLSSGRNRSQCSWQIYIAWSGEFLIRRLSKPKQPATDPSQHTHPSEDIPGGPPHSAPPKDPSHYELIIDNDSGTYRPVKELIPVLKSFLKRSFPELHIEVMECDDKKLDEIKDAQRKMKKKEGDGRIYGQASDGGSISSGDEAELHQRAGKEDVSAKKGGPEKIVEFLEKPGAAVKAAVPGQKGRMEREGAEEVDDQGAAGGQP